MAENEHAGHRKRLLAKLESGVLEDHEYMEALLFNAIPRMNTNEIAHRLLSQFGSFKGVFEARIDELKTVKGVGESVAQYLYLIGRVLEKLENREEKSLFPRRYEEKEFVEFLIRHYKGAKQEYLDCFFLDEKGKIKQMKRYTTGEKNSVDIVTGELETALVECRPNSLIVAHNHLSGTSEPSKEDVDTTCKIQVTCALKNIRFCDHLIVSPVDIYSFHATGRMKRISHEYNMSSIIRTVNEAEQNKGLNKMF